MKKMNRTLFAALLATGAVGTVVAGERIPVRGAYAAIDKGQVLELSKSHTVISAISEGLGYIIEGQGSSTPMQYAAGPCSGIIEIKDGIASGFGYCLRTNPSGGKWVLRWEALPDLSKGLTGKWEMTGVEGNAVGWKGSGTWGPLLNSNPGRYINTFSGTLEKP